MALSESDIKRLVKDEAERVADTKIKAALRDYRPPLDHLALDTRLKGTRHENSDHLERALNVSKLKPSTVDLRYLRTISGDVVWDDSNNIVSKVGSFNGPSGTGNYSVTGLGFVPALVMFTTGYATGSYVINGQGAMDANGNQWAHAVNTNLTNAATVPSTTACIFLITNGGATAVAAAYVSMDADGFTVNFSATDTNARIGWVAVSQPISVDVNDHGGLTGLGDDDHAQYHNDARGDARYWPLSTDLATQVELDAHISDSSAAHAASAISADSTTLVGTGTTAQAVFEELDNAIVAAENATAAHLADTTDAHAGSAITNTPAGTVAATTVQAAINELDTDKATTGSVTTVQTNLDTHIADSSAAHAASAVSVSSATLVGTGTDVQAVFEEVDNAIVAVETSVSNHLADSSAAHAASAVSADSTTLVGTGTDVQAVLEELDNGIADHLADSSAAHAATAISVDSTTLVGTGTTVQAVFEEMDNDIATLTAASGIPASIGDAKGDLIGFSAADTAVRITAASANGMTPISDSGETSGIAMRRGDTEIDLLRELGATTVAETMPGWAATDAITLGDALAFFVAMYVPYDVTITGLGWVQRVTGSTTGDNNNKVGLYTTDGTTLTKAAESTTDANLWDVATGWQTKAFSSTVAVAGGSVVYAAIIGNWSASVTAPAISGVGVTQTAVLNVGMATPKRFGFISGLTDLPATQALSGLTGGFNMPWLSAYV